VKLILAQPAIQRFQWELDVLLTNIRQFTDMEVILLFTEKDFTVPMFFRKKYGCSVFTFTDRREDTSYIPSVRPYLLWQYFREHPEAASETYFYIDSDIIFREWIDFATLGLAPDKVVGSTCDGYIGHDYIIKCERGPEIAQKIADICGINVDQMKGVPGIGAHIVLQNFSSDFWKRCYYDSNTIYHALEEIGGNIQKWTAEMWAQQWGFVREGRTVASSSELDFCLPTDDISRWDEVKIMHNAGILADKSHEMFFKGQYVETSPLGRNFDFVRKDKVSSKYVEAINNVTIN
jgi:hypothetical protein